MIKEGEIMISRKLTVGSLKPKDRKMSEHKVIQNTAPVQLERKPQKSITSKIKVMQNNKVYSVIPSEKKSSLLNIALQQNQMLSYKCKKGSCGKCTVKVLAGASCLDRVTSQERKKLKGYLEQNYRLSCQAIVK
jgi:ferredoxin